MRIRVGANGSGPPCAMPPSGVGDWRFRGDGIQAVGPSREAEESVRAHSPGRRCCLVPGPACAALFGRTGHERHIGAPMRAESMARTSRTTPSRTGSRDRSSASSWRGVGRKAWTPRIRPVSCLPSQAGHGRARHAREREGLRGVVEAPRAVHARRRVRPVFAFRVRLPLTIPPGQPACFHACLLETTGSPNQTSKSTTSQHPHEHKPHLTATDFSV